MIFILSDSQASRWGRPVPTHRSDPPRAGIEPATTRLKALRSTAELSGLSRCPRGPKLKPAKTVSSRGICQFNKGRVSQRQMDRSFAEGTRLTGSRNRSTRTREKVKNHLFEGEVILSFLVGVSEHVIGFQDALELFFSLFFCSGIFLTIGMLLKSDVPKRLLYLFYCDRISRA